MTLAAFLLVLPWFALPDLATSELLHVKSAAAEIQLHFFAERILALPQPRDHCHLEHILRRPMPARGNPGTGRLSVDPSGAQRQRQAQVRWQRLSGPA